MNKALKVIGKIAKAYIIFDLFTWAIIGLSYWVEYVAKTPIYTFAQMLDEIGEMQLEAINRIKKFWSWTKPSGYFREED